MLILEGHIEPVRSLSYAPDSLFLASGGEDNRAYLWDLTSGESVAEFEHTAEVERVSFNPRSGLLACGTAEGHLLVWERNTSSNYRGLSQAHNSAVRGLAHSPNGQLLVSLCWQGEVRFSQPDPLMDRGDLQTDQNETFQGTAFTFLGTDATIAVACMDGKVRMIDVKSRKVSNTLHNERSLLAIAAHGDHWLAAGTTSGAILLWDLPGKLLRAPLEGHSGPVYGLACTPDGKSLLSGGADGTVRVWEVESGQQRQCYRWHKSWVTCVAVAPNGMTAAAGSEDATVVVWDLDHD